MKPIPRKPLVCSNCGANGPSKIHRIKIWMDVDDKEGVSRSEARQRVYAGLLWLKEQKGYKAGYPAMKFLAIFGDRPNSEATAEPEPPDGELMAWLQRDVARWKRGKRAAEAEALRAACCNSESPV